MADFLTSMAQRTLGLLPIVQPIIASKYTSEPIDISASGRFTLLDSSPRSTMAKLSEPWEETDEQLSPPSLSPSIKSRNVPVLTTNVPGASLQSAESPQKQPSTASAAPITPQQAQITQAITNTPSSHVPQTMPTYIENSPLASQPTMTTHPSTHHEISSAISESPTPASLQPQTDVSQKKQPFFPAPTTKPRHAQNNPFSQNKQSIADEPPIHTQSGEIPVPPPLPNADTWAVPHKKRVEQQRIAPSPSSEESNLHTDIQAASSIKSPTLVPLSSSPIPAHPDDNPPTSKLNNTHARQTGTKRVPEVEQGQTPYPAYTKNNIADPYRIQPELAPSLVPQNLLPGPLLPTTASPVLRAEANFVEPLLPSVYPSIQTERIGTSIIGKHTAEQLSATSTTPIIRVTIGRIDIRAVTPTPPSASPAPVRAQRARPALSLDDYLKQRNGGLS